MTYTARQLIDNAWYLSSIVSRNLQTVSGDQASEGLDMLNGLLAMKSADLSYIPYWAVYDFTAVANQEKYFIPNLIAAETLTFYIGPVRYATSPQTRRNYFGAGRVDNISSLPFNWRLERVVGGSNLYLYFLPASTYPLQITAKFAFGTATLDQDLSLTMDQFYIQYLTFELAQYMCAYYNVAFTDTAAAMLERYRKVVKQISAPDMSIRKLSSFKKANGMSWADINLGLGWRPQ